MKRYRHCWLYTTQTRLLCIPRIVVVRNYLVSENILNFLILFVSPVRQIRFNGSVSALRPNLCSTAKRRKCRPLSNLQSHWYTYAAKQNTRASRDTYTIPFSTDLEIIYLAKPNIVMEWRMSKIPIRQWNECGAPVHNVESMAKQAYKWIWKSTGETRARLKIAWIKSRLGWKL